MIFLCNISFYLYSTEPSFKEFEDQFTSLIDYIVAQSQGIVRVDSNKIEPSRAILPHIKLDDEIVIVAKDIIRQVSFFHFRKAILLEKYDP